MAVTSSIGWRATPRFQRITVPAVGVWSCVGGGGDARREMIKGALSYLSARLRLCMPKLWFGAGG